MSKLELPKDLADYIAKALGWKVQAINEVFTFEETKDGFFIAQLKRKGALSTVDFKAMCALTRDLGGEYIRGTGKFRVPGPYAKKLAPPSTLSKAAGGPKPEPASGITPQETKSPDIPNIKVIPVDAIQIPPFLPTRELISHERLSEIRNSIKKHGLKYPIKVRRSNGDYELIDGFLRLKSVQELGWKGILAEIKEATDQQVIVESVITNKHRIEEDPITTAKKLDILVNAFGYTQEKLAEELGVSREWVANAIRLLKLPKEIQHCLALNNVSFYHALLLLTVEKSELQVQLAKEVVDKGLSTRELDERIRQLQPKPPTPSPQTPPQTEQPAGIEASVPVQPTEAPSTPAPSQEPEEEPSETKEEEAPETTKSPAPEPKPEPLLTGFEVECPECHEKILVNHKKWPSGKVTHEMEG